MTRLEPVIRAAVLALACALAGQAAAGEEGMQTLPSCEAHAGIAERIMRHRQEANDLESTWRMAWLIRDPGLSQVAQRLVSEAYRRPRQATEEDRERVVREFAAEARAACQED